MTCIEQAVIFNCAGEQLVGICARPDTGGGDHSGQSAFDVADCGVLIVVGGPQYRAGSHRQFLLLSRRLAASGFPTLRFDYRGMGDASGEARNFETVSEDIAVAVDTFQRQCPSVRRIVLWGLCDAASASLLYVQATRDTRISGLILLNPWVRSESSLAQTRIKHYYGQRLLSKEFWWKLFSGRLAVGKAVGGFLRAALRAKRGATSGEKNLSASFQSRMALGWRHFAGRVLLILSGEDYTAKEFLGYTAADSDWSGLLDASKVTRVDIEHADHTFSSALWRAQVEDATLDWLRHAHGR
ncbi:MAG TPA: hydrolase 1, exosortase A system-associated [Accumulibacter sp.]|nr:hydrolase 1, exosortase A system-associated [Accumulibacter sp.]